MDPSIHFRSALVLHVNGDEVSTAPHDLLYLVDTHDGKHAAAQRDQQDMHRMGRVQQVRRVFRSFSLWSFASIVLSTWEYLLLDLGPALTNGGRAGLFWSFAVQVVLSGIVTAALAEMASMAPSASGQYSWVSYWAPEKVQKYLSYLTGWFAVLYWQLGFANTSITAGAVLEQFIQLYRPEYELIPWRSTLMIIPPLVFTLLCNLFALKFMPMLQNFTMLLHVMGGILIMFTLWVAAPHIQPREVMLEFSNTGPYSNMFLALVIGQTTAQFSLSGMDAAVHMSEEVSDARRTVPRAMMRALWFNGVLGFLLLTSFLFSLHDLDAALADPAGPFLHVIASAWPSTGYAYTVWLLFLLVILGNVPFAAAGARLTFALARDGAMPFSKFLAQVDTRLIIPANAIVCTSILSLALSMLKLASPSTFYALMSMTNIAQMSTYFAAIACVLWRRSRNANATTPLLRARWSLGRKRGATLNAIALVYLAVSVFFVVWPTQLPITEGDFNFSGPITVGIALVCSLTYWFYGRKVYVSPRELVKEE